MTTTTQDPISTGHRSLDQLRADFAGHPVMMGYIESMERLMASSNDGSKGDGRKPLTEDHITDFIEREYVNGYPMREIRAAMAEARTAIDSAIDLLNRNPDTEARGSAWSSALDIAAALLPGGTTAGRQRDCIESIFQLWTVAHNASDRDWEGFNYSLLCTMTGVETCGIEGGEWGNAG